MLKISARTTIYGDFSPNVDDLIYFEKIFILLMTLYN